MESLSPGQRALWFEQQLRPSGDEYNLGFCLHLPRAIAVDDLDAALGQLCRRHGLLSARIDDGAGEPRLQTGYAAARCEPLHPAALPLAEAKARMAQLLLRLRPYDLASEPLLRLLQLPLAEGGSLLGMGCHHIIGDLRTMATLLDELDRALRDELPAQREPQTADYAEFCRWQAAQLAGERGAQMLRYWQEALSEVAGDTAMAPVAAAATADAVAERVIGDGSGAAVATLARALGTTPYAVLLTVFQALLSRRAGGARIVVGTPFSERTEPRFRRSVGYFVNLLPLLQQWQPGHSLREAVTHNATELRRALRHGHLPFATMVQRFAPPRSPGTLPWIHAGFAYQRLPAGCGGVAARVALGAADASYPLAGQQACNVPMPAPRAQFPLELEMAPTDTGYIARLRTLQGNRYGDAGELLDEFAALLRDALQQPDAPLLPAAVEAVDLWTLIERSIRQHAGRVALVEGAQRWSYRELGLRAEGVAAALRELGIGPGHRVVVLGDGSASAVWAMLGVLRCGAAFVPIDAEAAPALLQQRVAQARPSALLLALGGADSAADAWPLPVIDAGAITLARAAPPAATLPPLAPAWLMFTSGTTGAPKLAVIPQEAAVNHAIAMAARLQLTPEDRVLQMASLSFDEHAEEIFPTLHAGACLVCRPRIRYEEPCRLLAQADAQDISVLHLPTAWWHLWMDELPHGELPLPRRLRLVNVGGEAASVARLQRWVQQLPPGIRWFNSYGLTEAAVTSLLYELEPQALPGMDGVPVGLPIDHTPLQLLDDDGDPVPAGGTGELCIGGRGVGLGYFDNAAETAARFRVDAAGIRWLRSGDVARRLADGNFLLVGRRDRLLKVRGTRVEPAEVEAVINGHAAVAESVVTAGADPVATPLEAHVALRVGSALSEAQLREYLQQRLPATHRPARLWFHAAIPRTAGLKPDYARLRQRAARDGGVAAAAAGSDARLGAIIALFERLLGRGGIQAQDNFFSLGGHSLLAMRLVAALRRELGIAIGAAGFMAAPTPADVAAHGDAPLPLAASAAASGPQPADYPLSQAQRRARLLQFGAEAAAPQLALRLPADLDLDRLDAAWAQLLLRHELLTAATGDELNPPQPAAPVPALQRRRLAAPLPPGSGTAVWRQLRQERDELARAGRGLQGRVLLPPDAAAVLLVQAPLEAIDGGSVAILADELAAICSGAVLPPCRSYREYVEAEQRWLDSAAAEQARAFWREFLRDAGAPTVLPMFRPAPVLPGPSRRLALTLGGGTSAALLALARAQACSPFTVMLAAFVLLLQRCTREDELLIGLPMSLRGLLDAEGIVGPMLNPLPLRLPWSGREGFPALLARLRAALLSMQAHALLPFEQISPLLAAGRAALPLPIHFLAQEGGAAYAVLAQREGESPVPWLVSVTPGARCRIEFDYQPAVLADADAWRVLRAYRDLLRELARDGGRPLADYPLLPRAAVERRWAMPGAPQTAAAGLLQAGLEQAAAYSPRRIALSGGGRHYRYGELDHLANRLAGQLLAAGLRRGDRVVLLATREVADIVGLLAVLKAGGVYVPLARDTPPARLQELLQRVQAHCVLAAGPPALPLPCPWLSIDLADAGPCAAPAIERSADDPAYLLFTSGSSGLPKGVRVSHRAAMTTIAAVLERSGLGADDVFFGLSELGFDLSVFDVFGAFTAGARLVLPQAQRARDPQHWAECVVGAGVTVWNSVPSAVDMLLECAPAGALASLRCWLVSGDWVWPALVRRCRQACPDARFIALGGATEAAIWSNWQRVDAIDPTWQTVPYGRPLEGHSMVVLDAADWPTPVGVPGEICIGGAGLALGYWQDAVLTAQKFPRHRHRGERIYRTGDRGCYRPDGSVEILGRFDAQLKVRGLRVDPRDIEAALLALPGVAQAAVAGIPDVNGSTESLVAYLVAAPGAALEPAALASALAARLSPPLRPAQYRVLSALPLNANGKLDRRALPPVAGTRRPPSRAAESAGERRLLAIWQELLPEAEIGAEDDFFQLGGHSLLAARLLGRVQRESGRRLSLAQWLREPTLAAMARMLTAAPEAASGFDSGPVSRLRERVALGALDIGAPRIRPWRHLFLTGATGLVGSRLLGELLRHSEAVIHCLVRGDPAQVRASLQRRLAQQGIGAGELQHRLQLVQGELAQPLLGLQAPRHAELQHGIDVVFHVAADVNLIRPYEALAPANVEGTRHVLEFAAPVGMPLHYVSSIGVLPYGQGRIVRETDAIDGEGLLLTGYCQSKWVAEQLVRRAGARGLPVTIYRPGLTLGERPTADTFNVLTGLLALVQATSAVPDVDFPIDLVSVDYVAGAIRRLAASGGHFGATYHLTHPRPGSLRALAHAAGLRSVGVEEWKQRLLQAGPRLDRHAALLAELIGAQPFDELVPAAVDCSAAIAALQGTGLECEPVEALLSRLPELGRLAPDMSNDRT